MKQHLIKIFLLLIVVIWGCKKDLFTPSNTNLANVLTEKSFDKGERLAKLKEKFYAEKLNERLAPKSDKGIMWEPEWSMPRIQTINDSVSYVFYRLKASVKRNGRLVEAHEAGAASYLMVKNEKEFYKAFFYLPESLTQKNVNLTSAVYFMKNFTGKLLLSNLKSKQSFLLDYKDGRVSDTFKNSQLSYKKTQSVDATVLYWGHDCEWQMAFCTFVSGCTGQFTITYSFNCDVPRNCGEPWTLTDFSIEEICYTVWFDDPPEEPTEPTDPGGGIGGPGTVNPEDPNNTYEVETFADSIDLKSKLDCFNGIADNANTTYTAKLCADLPNNSNPLALIGPDNVGHAFITLTKTNGSNTITQTFGFYPQKGIKSVSGLYVNSQMQDDRQREYNASYTVNFSQLDFERMINAAQTYSALQYNLNSFNCTDYALAVFNAGLAINDQISVPDWTPSTYNYGTTPTGLYKKIKEMKDAGKSGATTTTGNAPISSNCN